MEFFYVWAAADIGPSNKLLTNGIHSEVIFICLLKMFVIFGLFGPLFEQFNFNSVCTLHRWPMAVVSDQNWGTL